MQMQLIMDIITLQLRKTVPPISLAILAHTAPQLHINPLAPIQNRPILCQTEVMDKEEEHAFPDVEVPHQRRCCRFKWSSVLAFALCIIVGYHAIRYVVVSPLVQPQISFSEW